MRPPGVQLRSIWCLSEPDRGLCGGPWRSPIRPHCLSWSGAQRGSKVRSMGACAEAHGGPPHESPIRSRSLFRPGAPTGIQRGPNRGPGGGSWGPAPWEPHRVPKPVCQVSRGVHYRNNAGKRRPLRVGHVAEQRAGKHRNRRVYGDPAQPGRLRAGLGPRPVCSTGRFVIFQPR